MATSMTGNSSETNRLLQRSAEGDQESWQMLLAQHRERLRRMVALRLDRRLQGRLDSSDVIFQCRCVETLSRRQGPLPEASSAALAAQLVGHRTTPSQAAMRAEMQRRLQEALNDMDPLDREILALRHFEQLTNAESARVLGLRESAASMRYA